MQNGYEFLSMFRLRGENNVHNGFEADVFLLNNSWSEFYHKTVKTLIERALLRPESFIRGRFGKCGICCADLYVDTIQRCAVFVLHC